MILVPIVFLIVHNTMHGDDLCLKQAFVAYEVIEPVSLMYKILPVSFLMASHIKNYGAKSEANLDEQIFDIESKSSDGRVRMGTHATMTERDEKDFSEMTQSDIQ